MLQMNIKDNGSGILGSDGTGQGLANIEMRTKQLNGKIELINEGGLKIIVTVPL